MNRESEIVMKNRPAGVRRRAIVTAMALTTVLFAVLGASSATAAPKGEYAAFAECPTSNAELSACIVARAESGSVQFGTETVPVVNVQTLQGGFIENEAGEEKFVGAAKGNTLTKTPQKVPGGLSGLVNCNEIKEEKARKKCEEVFENKLTGVYATIELAGPASSIGLNEANLFLETGTALSLPIKVKIENPLLGSTCYLGSESAPIVTELSSGTSGSLKGKLGTLSSRAEGEILVVKENSLVNNTVAVPGAHGCGGPLLEGAIDPVVNARLGIPAGKGKNKVTLNGTLEQTSAAAAREHE
jgi:hypothetical protein